jgi:beta-lactamase regulating signal transducer with metallopeptidase domain
VVLTGSLVAVCLATARGARAARRLVEQCALGEGPRDSVIVGGPEIEFAVAGIARPRIVVSAGALARLDDEELAAALDHEQAHIGRRHRYGMVLALGLRAVGRVVPGTGRAVRELAFQLERDADLCALRRGDDRLALASVICKAAGVDDPDRKPAIARLGGSGVAERLRQLVDESPPHRAAPALNALAVAMVACTLLLSALVPAAAVAGVGSDAHGTHHVQRCGGHR